MNDNVNTFYYSVHSVAQIFFSLLKIHMPIHPASTSLHVTRRENLHRLLREFSETQLASGSAAKGIEGLFAEHLQLSSSMLSQLKGSRNIGDKIAAQIAGLAGKELGWMDEQRSDIFSTPGESAFIELARHAWRATDSKGRRALMQFAKSGFLGTLRS